MAEDSYRSEGLAEHPNVTVIALEGGVVGDFCLLLCLCFFYISQVFYMNVHQLLIRS